MATRRPGHFHAVKFFESDDVFARIGAEFLAEGLVARQPALVIATPEHRRRMTAELRARHFDVEAMEAAGDLVLLDAEAMLGSFMVGGRPDANLFQATAARELDQRFGGRPIRAFGEGVDVLWKTGLDEAAIRLEVLWNRLAASRDIKTLCVYSVNNFYADASLRMIFDEHSHVISDKGAIVHAHPTVRWGGSTSSKPS
jgi:MEDS: MEthanogen/methylotroph, DcmR Sensory domain